MRYNYFIILLKSSIWGFAFSFLMKASWSESKTDSGTPSNSPETQIIVPFS